MWTREEIEGFKQRLKDLKNLKKDYIVPCSEIQTQYDVGTNQLRMRLGINGDTRWFDMNSWMQNQVAEKCHIHKNFYDYLMESGHQDLLATNINELIRDKEKRMVRTIGNTARALVSDEYRAIDNYDMMDFFVKNIDDLNTSGAMDIVVDKCEVTDTRIYMRCFSNRLTDTIFGEIDRTKVGKPLSQGGLEKGDVVHGGIILSNSEVGDRAYSVQPFMYVVSCNNGMISDQILRRRHIGKKLAVQEIDWSTKTKTLEDEVLWNQLTDLMYSTFNPDKFQKWVEAIQNVAREEITEPIIAVNNVVTSYDSFRKGDQEELLKRFAQYGLSKWGLTQAMTDFAQTQDFDRRVAIECDANDMLLNKPIAVLQATNGA